MVCAAEPWPVAPTAHPDTVVGNPLEEGASVAVPLLPSPALPLSSCGVVLVLGQGHRDALPFVSEPRAQASFPPTAGRALTVVACTKHGARWKQKKTGSTTVMSHLEPSCSGGGGVCGARDLENGMSVQARFYMHLIGWQNAWEQAPGVPATPSPP